MGNPYDALEKMEKFNAKYLTLKDGESAEIPKVVEVKYPVINKFGNTCMQLVFEVEATHPITGELVQKELSFTNGSRSFTGRMAEYNVQKGYSFVLSRKGSGTKTEYFLDNVKDADGKPAVPRSPKRPEPTEVEMLPTE